VDKWCIQILIVFPLTPFNYITSQYKLSTNPKHLQEEEISNEGPIHIFDQDWPLYWHIDKPVCQTIWNDVWPCKRWEIMLHHNAQCHLGQSEDWVLPVSLSARTASNVWRNVLSRICQSIEHHFKRSVNTVILQQADCYLTWFMGNGQQNQTRCNV